MGEALEGYDKGFQLGGRYINNLRYADDVILIATSEGDLQYLVSRVQNASERVGLLINSSKIKVMTSGKNKISEKICLNGEYLEQVESTVYLWDRCSQTTAAVCGTLRRVWQWDDQ